MADAGNPGGRQKPKRVLIVDDDPMYVDIYSMKLRMEGYEVDVAEDGQQGLDMARAMRPDVILLDVMMPKLNGHEVLKRLRQDEQTKDIPVLMFSIVDQEKEVARALDAGAKCYLVKSDMTPQAILDEIRRCVPGF